MTSQHSKQSAKITCYYALSMFNRKINIFTGYFEEINKQFYENRRH